MDIPQISDDILNTIRNVIHVLRNNCTYRKTETWIKVIKTNLKLFKKAIQNQNIPIQMIRKIQTNIGHLLRLKELLLNIHLTRIGGGIRNKIENRSERAKWEDIESAFSRRLRTSICINLKHTDILAFLIDCFILFKTRITNLLKKFPIMIKLIFET